MALVRRRAVDIVEPRARRQLLVDRLVQLGKVVGKDRLLAGTDCGFDTFIRFSQVDPGVAWLKLKALSEGAEIASAEL